MPAKTGKGKQPKKKGGNASEQVLELRKELDDMRARAERAESLLSSVKTEVKRLRRQQDRLSLAYEDRVIELDRQKHSYEAELTAAQEELATAKAFVEHMATTGAEEKAQLQGHVNAADAVERENARLRARVTELMRAAHEEGLRAAEELHTVKQQVGATCARLEQTFRTTLQRLDRERREEILQSLRAESREAMRDNQRLRQELAAQASGIQQLTGRMETVQRKLGAAKRGKELLELERTAQSQHALDLRASAKRAAAELEAAREEVQALEAEVERARGEAAAAKELEAGRLRAVEAAKEFRNEAMKWKRRALDLTRAMTFEPGRLAGIRRRSAKSAGVEIAYPTRTRPRPESATADENGHGPRGDPSTGRPEGTESPREELWRASLSVSVEGLDTTVVTALGWTPPSSPAGGQPPELARGPAGPEHERGAGEPPHPEGHRRERLSPSPLLKVKLAPAAAGIRPHTSAGLRRGGRHAGSMSTLRKPLQQSAGRAAARHSASLPSLAEGLHVDTRPPTRARTPSMASETESAASSARRRRSGAVRPVSRLHRAGLE